eukprot:TRINITY_DN241_c0_g1_i2.p1 TRINITY_DN241_c0_g1~~TRINITY_DN241_c0_g1_i2.p1  ORF type:complete len:175 (+),score=57.23 TRINITY_DN241_c0_g1_i2:214-738(+)
MDFEYVPFGNAFVEIKECADPSNDYTCWKRKCGPKATPPIPSDCFTGSINCQHGSGECYGNLVEVCVKNMTNNNPWKYMPFVDCFEAHEPGAGSKAHMEKCAKQYNLSPTAIASCESGPTGKALMAVAARTTVMVKGMDYVPYFTLNGKVLKNSDNLLEAVCNDWEGTKPPGCK